MGVTKEFATIKFSGSPNIQGEIKVNINNINSINIKPKISLYEKYKWNGTLSKFRVNPKGLLEPVSCKNTRWTTTKAVITNGTTKWKTKKRVRVGLLTENPPHKHMAISSPTHGMAVRRPVITEVPQKDICPQGRT